MTTIGSGIGIFGVVSIGMFSLYVNMQIILLACGIEVKVTLSYSKIPAPRRHPPGPLNVENTK